MEYSFSYTNKKGFQSINVWEEFTPKEWLAILPAEIQQQQISSLQVPRLDWEIEMWQLQTVQRLDRVESALSELKDLERLRLVAPNDPRFGDDEKQDRLAYWFPGNYNELCASNRYGHKCQMYEVCYQHKSPLVALESGEYVKRVPHYELEG